MRRIKLLTLTLAAGLGAYRMIRRARALAGTKAQQESLGRWEDEGGAAQAAPSYGAGLQPAVSSATLGDAGLIPPEASTTSSCA